MNIDFETYSESGFIRTDEGKLSALIGANKRGLPAIGAAAYAQHPSTEILSLAYGESLWIPGLPPPTDLFDYIKQGGLIHAWNSSFEWLIWKHVCKDWPELPLEQMRCTMARANAHALPGKLEKASEALGSIGKIEDGKRLINKFSIPRNPTKKNLNTRIRPCDDLIDGQKFYDYNLQDVKAEIEISGMIPELSPEELKIWQVDQTINIRGCAIDTEAVEAAIKIIEKATCKGNARLSEITGGQVNTVKETAKLKDWLNGHGLNLDSVDKAAIATALDIPGLDPLIIEVLKIRQTLSKSSTSKLYAFKNRLGNGGRIRGMFKYSGAGRTKRWAGGGVQPHNLPNDGPEINFCPGCRGYCDVKYMTCPHCGHSSLEEMEWNSKAMGGILDNLGTAGLDNFDNPFEVIASCLRGLFIAAPGHDLICSDYSAIEAVILAELAGEKWRQDVFRTHGRIYEMSAAKITGIPMGENRHPHRGLGKLAELASGYQGSVGAWKRFGADKFFNRDEDILEAVRKWRRASPAIAGEYDGFGQWQDGLWGKLEEAAKAAIQNPGKAFQYRSISYQVSGDILYCKLPSGGLLAYHQPRLNPFVSDYGRDEVEISYMNWNTSALNGPVGWYRTTTYGGKLTENATQATARDILANALVNLEEAGYPGVLHIHDEVVCEVLKGWGSIEEFEKIMSTMPPWASDWPIKAVGGWRGKRYRKG